MGTYEPVVTSDGLVIDQAQDVLRVGGMHFNKHFRVKKIRVKGGISL